MKVDTPSQAVELKGDGVADLTNNQFKLSFALPSSSSIQGTINEVYVGHVL